jgi:hypothetical protein
MAHPSKRAPHWIGHLVRKKLGLRTEERHRGFMIATGEEAKLTHLYQKYGITGAAVDSAGSVDFAAERKSMRGATYFLSERFRDIWILLRN